MNGTCRFITAVTSVRPWFLSGAKLTQSVPSHSVSFKTHLHIILATVRMFLSGLPTTNVCAVYMFVSHF